MRKKRILLIGILALMVFSGIPKNVNAETEEVYSLEGSITYDKDNWRDFNGTKEEWEILYNISIPIPLKSGRDRLYWYNRFEDGCDDLTIIFYFRPIPEGGSGGDAFYIYPDDNDVCDQRKYHDAGNFSPDNRNNTFVLVKRRGFLNPKGYLYHLTWKFWIERDIVENQPNDINDIIGINLMPFLLGFICIGVIIVYTKKIKN
ncbi:hypothetical protein LCGC14_0695430 [marine sediment metagenome]|uniref:Uncharacterized protein n=1 Tax=marine sediment metagenome TaxID=412755 RepID=A0A0F9T5G1_9ZZZZ|nr:MAG: hypothetical protein Lokiarch_41850 [Candidatus Lokiarchaeum sp. GC14_75]HEC38636.1 hypothetical protein [bacterium]